MTSDELRRLQAIAEDARIAAMRADQARNAAIREAIEDNGWTHAQIARATGLTRGRIGQIAGPAKQPS